MAMSAASDQDPDFDLADDHDFNFADDPDHDFDLADDPDHEFDLADDVEPEMDHAPDEQPFEAPVALAAPVAPIEQPPVVAADLGLAPTDPVPSLGHDPIFAEIYDIAPILPDLVLMFDDHALFAASIDTRYADTHNGWVDVDDYPPYVRPVTPLHAPISAPIDVTPHFPHVSDIHRTDLPITFLQDIPPPRSGEGSSRQQPAFVPPVSSAAPFMSQFPRITPSFAHMGEPFLWSSPNVMPLSDPYHPFHVGYTVDDILISLQL
ncbi:hypothetical protein Hdeb2414_s0006g00204431 [Helianthus debilis subsp. tardiflorus]